MLRARFVTIVIFASCALLLACGSSVRAQEKGAHGEKAAHGEVQGHAAVKYQADYHDPETNKDTTGEFDLSKPEDKAKLDKLIAEGHVHELRLAENPSISILFSLSTDLGVISLIVFALLMYVLSKIAWPKMIQGLKSREDRIRGALEEAQKTKDEAHAIHESLQKQLNEAHAQVKQIVDEGRRDAQALRESEMAKTKADIQAERDRLHREIEVETDQALQTIWTRTAELATQISSQALRKQLDVDSHRRLIDEALVDLRTASGGANGHA